MTAHATLPAANLLDEFRIEPSHREGRTRVLHLGKCGWYLSAPPALLGRIVGPALDHATVCAFKETGGYHRISAPEPGDNTEGYT